MTRSWDTHPRVSAIVPALDAEATLPSTLRSIFEQDCPGGLEVIVADGSASSATSDLLRAQFPAVRRIPNPGRGISAGLNLALAAARGAVIARCDAHSTLPPGYLARALATLERTGAANVGGRTRPVGVTAFERAVALTTSHALGTGAARYRVGGGEGPVDTVFPGVFRRKMLEAAGGWDETLERNEDYELNWRLRELGDAVWFDPLLAVDYRPRGSPRALARQYFDYGRWKAVVLGRHPRAWRARQLPAPLLVAWLVLSAALLAVAPLFPGAAPALSVAGAAVPLAYALALLGGSAAIALRNPVSAVLLVPAVAVIIHLAWGAGFLAGLPRALRGARGGPNSERREERS